MIDTLAQSIGAFQEFGFEIHWKGEIFVELSALVSSNPPNEPLRMALSSFRALSSRNYSSTSTLTCTQDGDTACPLPEGSADSPLSWFVCLLAGLLPPFLALNAKHHWHSCPQAILSVCYYLAQTSSVVLHHLPDRIQTTCLVIHSLPKSVSSIFLSL